MTPSYNLVDEPWIPCVTPSGAVEHRGILETLARAAEFKEIRDPSPLVTIALHRMLLAVLHRVFGPESPDAWSAIWKDGSGRFDQTKLDAYLSSANIHPRFDLFHEKHPFYQTASLPVGPIVPKSSRHKYVKPIGQMAHELAYSDSMNLFTHFSSDCLEARPCANAARWLLALHAFALGGRITFEAGRNQDGSADGGQLTKSAVVMATGDSTFQTLMLNLVHYSHADEAPFRFKPELDKPAWERDDETKPADRRYDGYLDLLTWQSRRVKLLPAAKSDDMVQEVAGAVMMKGFQLPEQYWRKPYETMVSYVKAKDPKDDQEPWPPLGFRSSKALWRDCHTLLQSISEQSERPRVLSWVDDLRQDNRIDRPQVTLEVFGISSTTFKIFFWRHEFLPVPLSYLSEPALVESVKVAVRVAERVAETVVLATFRAMVQIRRDFMPATHELADQAVQFTARNDRAKKRKKDPIGDQVKSLAPDRDYWAQLEQPFQRFMANLGATIDATGRSSAIAAWVLKDVTPVARRAFARVVRSISRSQRELHGIAVAEHFLDRKLRRIESRFGDPASSTSEERHA